jgi:hypothetical protein
MQEGSSTCKFCGSESKLIKAHIIPAGLFRRLQKGDKPLELMTNKAGEHIKKAPIGVYDRTIVCGKCEKIWQEWDEYAQQLLTDGPLNGRIIYHENKALCYVVDSYDYQKLKLFFISLLWRAAVSSHPFFSKVSIGEFEDIAKWHIVSRAPGNSSDFSITLARFENPLAKPILDPHTEKFSDVNYVRFYLSGYIAYIKVDHKPAPMPLAVITLSEKTPLYILCRDFTKSKELDLMRKIITS